MNFCIDCGVKLKSPRAKRCKPCVGKSNRTKKRYSNCLSCNVEKEGKQQLSPYCKPCADNRLIKNKCESCGTKVSRKEVRFCKPCSTLHRYGRPAKPKYHECVDCGVPKDTRTAKTRPRCHTCACAHRAGKPEEVRLKKNTGRAVRAAIHRSAGSKEGERTFDYLPYTLEELKEHLEAQFDDKMTWDNYGTYWHVDHIFPQSRLPFDSLEHPNFQKCWALSNLQPLEAKANQSKGAKIL